MQVYVQCSHVLGEVVDEFLMGVSYNGIEGWEFDSWLWIFDECDEIDIAAVFSWLYKS